MNLMSSSSRQTILILGPCRSGKSEFAEVLAARCHQSVTYVATADIDTEDCEWQERIAKHQQRRPDSWQTISATHELDLLVAQANATECLLIDSFGTWVAKFLDRDEAEWQQICDRLLSSLVTTVATIIIVAEETGWGVVPAYPLGRLFRDRLGDLARRTAELADKTYLVTGGHAIDLSVLGEPLSKYKI